MFNLFNSDRYVQVLREREILSNAIQKNDSTYLPPKVPIRCADCGNLIYFDYLESSLYCGRRQTAVVACPSQSNLITFI